ncbi:MAG: MCE family protein [Bacteroidetes bacterium]|nr:MCE family protein [Fibrella sp.]
MKSAENKRAIIVGIFVLVGIVILVTGILVLGGQQKRFVKSVKISAIFDDVSGLKTGDNVWFSGVKIGTVRQIRFYGQSQVEVRLNIEVSSQPYIRKDARATIGSDGLIGNKIVVIEGGTPRSVAVVEGDRLESRESLSSEQILDTLQITNRNLLKITADVENVISQIGKGKGVAGAVLTDSVLAYRFKTAVASLQDASVNAKKMTGTLAQFSTKLNTKGTLANELVTDTTVFSNLKASAIELKQAASSATDVANNAKRASEKLNSTDNAIGILLNDQAVNTSLKKTINSLESSSKKLDEDLEAAQHNFLLRGFFRKRDKAAAKQKADSLKAIK